MNCHCLSLGLWPRLALRESCSAGDPEQFPGAPPGPTVALTGCVFLTQLCLPRALLGAEV